MPYYYHGSDLVYTDNGSLGASFNPGTRKCPNCHRETSIDSDKCDICDYDFTTGKVDKYTCPNCKRQISSKLIKCVACNYDFITGKVDTTKKNCYETNKKVSKKRCPECGKLVNKKFVDCVYCGYDFILKKSDEDSNLNSEYIDCPNCNKNQLYSNKICEICGCDLDMIDLDYDNKILLDNLAYSNVIISQEKYDLFLNNKYFNSPSYSNSLDNFYERSIFIIKSKFKKGSVLYLSLSNARLHKISELLKKEGYGEYLNNNSMLKKNETFKLLNSLLADLDKLKEINKIFIEKFSLKLPNNISSCKYFISLIKYNNVKYLSNKELIDLNEFIRVYWKYWNLITSSNIDLSSSKLLKYYLSQLNQYKDLYIKYLSKEDFDIPVLNLIYKLNGHIAFTDMINNMKINENIQYNYDFEIFEKEIDNLDVIINSLNEKLSNFYSDNQFNPNISFEKIKYQLIDISQNIKNIDEKGIILMNINDALIFFNDKSHLTFDYIIYDDDISIGNDTKLKLFLMSKNKLSSVKLWYR